MSIDYIRFGVEISEDEYTDAVICKRVCPFCGKKKSIETDIKELGIILFKKRGLEQTNPSLREMFITGICDDCWPAEPDE